MTRKEKEKTEKGVNKPLEIMLKNLKFLQDKKDSNLQSRARRLKGKQRLLKYKQKLKKNQKNPKN